MKDNTCKIEISITRKSDDTEIYTKNFDEITEESVNDLLYKIIDIITVHQEK